MDDDFQGYVRAKLEELSTGQQNQWTSITGLREEMKGVEIKIAELRTTARLAGAFAGVIAGVFASFIPKPWK